jgi:hypothetical protein
MQDIRKPYTRSRSSNDLQSRVEQFEAARYRRDDYEDEERPVQIPVRKVRRDIDSMDMYPRRREDDLFDDEFEESDERNFNRRSTERRADRPRGRRRTSLSTVSFIIGIVALVVGVILYTYVFNSATVTVVPKYKDVSEIGKVFVFGKEGENMDTGAIPFVVETVSLSKSKTLTLSESRKVEAKASGKITVYNNYDSAPQKLIKNTRFESSKGKIYRISQSIEIPGKKGNTPGSVDVTIYADSNGADYNMTSGDFTIPGFKGTAQEKGFYAKTKTPITGGSSGTMSLASLSDLNAAKDSLAVELAKSVKEDAFKIKKEGYIPLYAATEITYEDNENEILSGATAVYKVTATAHVMLADASKLAESIAKNFGDYDTAPVRLTYVDTLTFTRKQADRIVGNSSLSILVEGKPRVVWETNAEDIKELVQGKKRDEFKPLMKTINSIESAEISFSPMWLSRFPSDTSKLIINESLPKR